MHVQTGAAELVLAGGAESMSQVELYATEHALGRQERRRDAEGPPAAPRGSAAGGEFHPVPGGMIETAENLRRQYRDLARGAGRAGAALPPARGRGARGGIFAEEIVPVKVPEQARRPRRSSTATSTRAPDTSLERLAALRPIMLRHDPDATVTAGNASGQNDGAAVCIVTHPERAAELGLKPYARLVAGRSPGSRRRRWASGRCRPWRRRSLAPA